MTTLYKLPGKAMQTLKLATGGGPSQSTVSLLPTIMATLLDRLANPSPTHHAFRAPFIRPLLNKNASKQPIFNLLTPAIAPRPQDLEPDSPEQARLIEFFEEKKENLLRNTSIDQTLPPSIYCTHKKDLIGPPKLLFNETYNIALTKASKHTAIIHAVGVISHQLSLMLQAMADEVFTIKVSRKPHPDSDRIDGLLDVAKRASWTDFQMEKRSSIWYIVGVLQPLPPNLLDSNGIAFSPAEPYSDEVLYQPRALSQSKTSRFAIGWDKENWLQKSTLDFFTEENTESLELEAEALTIQTRRQSNKGGPREVYFASPITHEELSGLGNTNSSLNTDQTRPRPTMNPRNPYPQRGNVEDDIDFADWEVLESEQRHSKWVDKLSASELLQAPSTPRSQAPWKAKPVKVLDQPENPWALPKERKPMRPWNASNTDGTGTKPSSKPHSSWGEALPKMSEVRSSRSQESQKWDGQPQKKDNPPVTIARRGKAFSKFEREEAPHPGRQSKR